MRSAGARRLTVVDVDVALSAIDIGGTKLAAALVDDDGAHARRARPTTVADPWPTAVGRSVAGARSDAPTLEATPTVDVWSASAAAGR